MSEGVAPRPRPRPRAKARPATTNQIDLNVNDGTVAGPSQAPLAEVQINDNDDFFVINRGRTKETWRKLDEINKVTIHVSDDEGSEDGPSTPARKRAKQQNTPRRWRNDKEAIRLLSVDLSDSGTDSDLDDSKKKSGIRSTVSPQKRKRLNERPRSRSITPPPEVPAAVIQNARNLISRVLDSQGPARSPVTLDDDDFDVSTDTIVLDPELARIAKAINSQVRIVKPISQTPLESETINITVKWQKHPLSVAEKEPIFIYRISRDESFRDLFDATAEDAQVRFDHLVISYRHNRIFPSTTSAALDLWGDAEFVACLQSTYDYLRKQAREIRIPSPIPQPQPPPTRTPTTQKVIDLSDDDDDGNNGEVPTLQTHTQQQIQSQSDSAQNNESDAESEAEGEKFKVVLRSNKNPKDIILIVRPTTKCGAIVKAFLRKAGLADQYPHVFAEGGPPPPPPPKSVARGRGRGRGRGRATVSKQVEQQVEQPTLPDPRLSVDGERLPNESEIGEADLDDGDMIEVVGL